MHRVLGMEGGMGHLDGKTAIVTGAGTGMGKATAITYARQGAKVLAWDLGVDVEGRALQNNPVDETIEVIKEAGGEAIPFYGDVSSMSDSEDAVRTVIDTWGQLDILTCIAGILRERMVFNMIEEEWDDVVRVHMKGTFAPTKFAAIHWRQRREYGRLIAFSSGAFLGSAGQPNYAAAKAGIVGFIRSTALAMARYEVTANAITPGAATRMNDRSLGTADKIRGGDAPPSQVHWGAGTDRDAFNVPPMLVFLASPEGRMVSGKVIQAVGWHFGLYNDPEVMRELHSGEKPWDMDYVFEHFNEALTHDLELPGARTADSIRADRGAPTTPNA